MKTHLASIGGGRNNYAHFASVHRRFIFLLLALFASHLAFSQTVYVTRTGEKYHASGCRYLSKSKIETTLADAKEKGYTACSVCKPTTTVISTQQIKTSNPSDCLFPCGE